MGDPTQGLTNGSWEAVYNQESWDLAKSNGLTTILKPSMLIKLCVFRDLWELSQQTLVRGAYKCIYAVTHLQWAKDMDTSSVRIFINMKVSEFLHKISWFPQVEYVNQWILKLISALFQLGGLIFCICPACSAVRNAVLHRCRVSYTVLHKVLKVCWSFWHFNLFK